MGPLIPLALTLAPELARWLSGTTAESTTTAVNQAIQAVTSTSDPVAAAAMLQHDPAVATLLRLKLAQLAADQESAARAAELQGLAATLRNTAPNQTSQASATAWSAPVVSGIVLLTFCAVMTLVLTYGVPSGSETVANMLLGTLAAMATSVVSYWVGSSAGSARKDERIAQANRPNTQP